MYNMILDRLPTEYEGYLIRTSFRIGIQICLCLQDEELTGDERMAIALNLLYGNGLPDLETAMNGLIWFMSCGNPSKNEETDEKQLFYWDFDSARIYSSFENTYGIDLTKEDMHWFKFVSLMGSLDKDCAFSKAVEIRDYDVTNIKGKHRTDIMKMKQSLTPKREYTDEEKQKIEEFNSLLEGGDVNA